MKNAEMKVIRFGAEDVIATSGVTGTITGVEDNTPKNVAFTGTLFNENDTKFQTTLNGQTWQTTWGSLVKHDENDNGTGAVSWLNNTTWTWDGTKFTKQ